MRPIFCAGRIYDGDIPGTPILRPDLSKSRALGIHQVEVDFTNHVLLLDLSDLSPAPFLNEQSGLEHFVRPSESQNLVSGGIVDGKLMGEELIHIGCESEHLPCLALAFLLDKAKLDSFGIPNDVLICQLNEFGFLTHHDPVRRQ